ncbi:hypothetical protein LY78DRAFT_732086 [Colletotrichum sublineola]|uniref:Uncharacterized protein n=1 Tax=Colletotrichum sublineola TaxID=1173701 RepID=A0A066XM92_COLSU|nr:hypothetical protein LY78DRAFT_732086 [Colletotrichum sublineola]KDN68754.1 hypothetical protein CSUB01_08195 [Colletotrichum sublineola]
MKLLLLITYCIAVFANPILDVTAWNDTEVQVRDSAADSVNDGASLGRLLSRDSREAYDEATRAAGGSLRPNSYYYFMDCVIASKKYKPATFLARWALEKYGCSHVGLVVGKTNWLSNKFTATYIHVRLFNDGFWQTAHDYSPMEDQYLIYGGRTSSSKASKAKIERIIEKGEEWVKRAGIHLTERYNCVTHYMYLKSFL